MKLKSEYFSFDSKGALYSIGVKVLFTSSLSVNAKRFGTQLFMILEIELL